MPTRPLPELFAQLQAAGFRCRLWKGRRIYFDGLSAGASAWIEDARRSNTLAGKLMVFVSIGRDGTRWRTDQARGVKHGLLLKMQAHGIVPAGSVPVRAEDVSLA